MSSPPQKHVVFDVVGTCVSFSAFYHKIDQTIGPSLRSHNLTAQIFGYSWMTVSELEFTFLSISERYKPYKEVLKALFYRTLFMAGIANPRSVATEREREICIEGYSELELRPGLGEAFGLLRKEGWTVWCLTTGDVKRVRGYFEKGGVDMPLENFISCDSSGLAKPALKAYEPALLKFGENDEKWFAAAHMWDVSAAVKAGFRGAYCTVYEMDPCEELFGDDKMDVVADSLVGMAKGIVEATR